jgi:hypothetical protein
LEPTNTPELHFSDPMDSDSDAGNIQSNPKRRRTRIRRWYLFAAVILVMLFLALQGLLLYSSGCTQVAAYSGVSFDLTSVLAHAARPVHVRACVPSSCASITVKKRSSDGSIPIHGPGIGREWDPLGSNVVRVNDSSLAWLPVTVRLTVEDQAGDPVFDSSARVQPHFYQPNGPGCEPTAYGAAVVATRNGRLVPQT